MNVVPRITGEILPFYSTSVFEQNSKVNPNTNVSPVTDSGIELYMVYYLSCMYL